MRRIRSPEEMLRIGYLTIADIQRVFGISYYRARDVYKYAFEIDKGELKYHIFPDKVRMTSVCKVIGVSLNTLQKQIKSATSSKEQSA